MDAHKDGRFKVVIIGGGITGLTLAHCLDRAGVEFVLLEKHHDVCANIGGAIAMQPNGSRILDQLGIYESLKMWTSELCLYHTQFPDGDLSTSSWPAMTKERFGYPVEMVARSDLLRVLFSSLQQKERVKLGVKVTSIDQTQPNERLSVTTGDGSKYIGDVVVGADGIHSVARMEMWRLAALRRPGLITEKCKKAVRVHYLCIFGIAKPELQTAQLKDIICHHHRGWSFLVFPCHGGAVTWLAIFKLDQPGTWPDAPRWSREDVQAQIRAVADMPAWEHVCIRDVWNWTADPAWTPLYEGLFRTWSFGRIACIGDSVFKATPNLGIGANMSIESAATIANTLCRMSHSTTKPTHAEVEVALKEYKDILWKRFATTDMVSKISIRSDAMESMLYRAVGLFVAKWSYDRLMTNQVRLLGGAVLLDYLPHPERSRKALEKHAAEKGGRGNTKAIGLFATALAVFLFFWFKQDPVSG